MNTMTTDRRSERLTRLGILQKPLGYVDGGDVYEYVKCSPVGGVDPMGLAAIDSSLLEVAPKVVSTIYYDPADKISSQYAEPKGTALGTVSIGAVGIALGSGHGTVRLNMIVAQTVKDFGGRKFGQDVSDSGHIVIDGATIAGFQKTSDTEAKALNATLYTENVGQDWCNTGRVRKEGNIWMIQDRGGGYSNTRQSGRPGPGGKFVGNTGINFVWKYEIEYELDHGEVVGGLKFTVDQVFALMDSSGNINPTPYQDYGDFFDNTTKAKNYTNYINDMYKLHRDIRDGKVQPW